MLAPVVLMLLLVPGPFINTRLGYNHLEEIEDESHDTIEYDWGYI